MSEVARENAKLAQVKKSVEENDKVIYTVGHSTRSEDDFVELLASFQVEMVVDVRRFPGSRKYPHFNRENLEKLLPENGIQYIHLEELGGRRKTTEASKNTTWRHPAFRGYADYMETEDFEKGVQKLQQIATTQRTVFMCSEAVWWSCHRSMVSDYLKAHGWEVRHIMAANKANEHPYTQPARIKDGELTYRA